MRLIDADELKTQFVPNQAYFTANIVWKIEAAPTVDAVPVVRCRDCCYKDKANVNNKGFLICPASGMEITDDDYCSYGERKGGDE